MPYLLPIIDNESPDFTVYVVVDCLDEVVGVGLPSIINCCPGKITVDVNWLLFIIVLDETLYSFPILDSESPDFTVYVAAEACPTDVRKTVVPTVNIASFEDHLFITLYSP